MKHTKTLNEVEKKVHDLAVETANTTIQAANLAVENAKARLNEDLKTVRRSLGVPEGCHLKLDNDKDGNIVATWDDTPPAPKNPPGDVAPRRKRRK